MKIKNTRGPDFIGIGAMRSGTTWLTKCIDSHPDMFIPPAKKEINFFNLFSKESSTGQQQMWNYSKGIDWYEEHFSQANKEQKTGEYSPHYLCDQESPKLIHKNYPNVKLILSLRNPIDRAFSHYQYIRRYANVPNTFEEALYKNLGYKYLQNGLYGKYLENYLNLFDKEQIHIIFFEDIKNKKYKLISKLYSFLEVEHNFISPILSKKINTSNVIRLKKLQSLFRDIRIFVKNNPKMYLLWNKIGLVELGRNIQKINTTKHIIDIAMIKVETKKYLIDYYRDDIEKLENILSLDLSHWKIV